MKEKYGKLQYNGIEYLLAFNLNVMGNIQEKYGSIKKWNDLCFPDDDTEANIKAFTYGLTEMLNEGIDIQNEEHSDDLKMKPLTVKQVGRIITDVGLEIMAQKVINTVVDSTETGDESKNV